MTLVAGYYVYLAESMEGPCCVKKAVVIMLRVPEESQGLLGSGIAALVSLALPKHTPLRTFQTALH